VTPSAVRPTRDANPAVEPKLVRDLPTRTSSGVTRRDIASGARGAPTGGAVTSNRLGGVNLDNTRPSRGPGAGLGTGTGTGSGSGSGSGSGGHGDTTIINNSITNNSSTVNYVTNVNYANSCWNNGWNNGWCAPVYGPGACWNNWSSGNGFSFGIGFGTGNFSFGFFYGANNAPFCSSWCNPWWNGWSGFVSVGCGPSWNWCRPCWSPCGGPWWSNYVVYESYPSWCVPVYSYTPVAVVPSVTYVNYTTYSPLPSVVVVPPPFSAASIPMVAQESQAWDLLGNGFPRSAADGFAQLHDANPANARALAGYGIALAMLDDISAAAAVMRDAVAIDPAVVSLVPLTPSLTQRMQLLESSAEVASRQAASSRDALFLLAAWRSTLGQYGEAQLALVVAQQQGETSTAATVLRTWLELRLAGRI